MLPRIWRRWRRRWTCEGPPLRTPPPSLAALASRQRVTNELHAVLHFLNRRRLSHVLVFDDRVNRVLLFLQQAQDVRDRRLSLPPRLVRTVVPPAILQVQMRDAVFSVLLDERN